MAVHHGCAAASEGEPDARCTGPPSRRRTPWASAASDCHHHRHSRRDQPTQRAELMSTAAAATAIRLSVEVNTGGVGHLPVGFCSGTAGSTRAARSIEDQPTSTPKPERLDERVKQSHSGLPVCRARALRCGSSPARPCSRSGPRPRRDQTTEETDTPRLDAAGRLDRAPRQPIQQRATDHDLPLPAPPARRLEPTQRQHDRSNKACGATLMLRWTESPTCAIRQPVMSTGAWSPRASSHACQAKGC